MRAHRKSGGLDLEEIRAEAHKRQKEMGDAARAAEMTKEELALEKRKGLAEKEATRRAASGQAGKDKHAAGEAKLKAATGQAGTAKRAAEEAKRKAATRQAGTVKRAAEEAKRKAATGQAGTAKRAAEEAARWAASRQAGKDKHAGVEATRRAASGQAGKDKHAAGEATRWAKKRLQRLRRLKKRPRSSANRGRSNASFMHNSPARPTRRTARLGAPRRLASSTTLTSPG
jgi:hypothetical protein